MEHLGADYFGAPHKAPLPPEEARCELPNTPDTVTGPAAVYLLPSTEQALLTIVALAATVALPLYLLVFRPVSRTGVWGPGEMVGVALLLIPLYLFLAVSLNLVGYEAFSEPSKPLTIVPFSIVTIAQNVAFVGLSVYVVIMRYRLDVGRLGLRFDRLLRHLSIGVVVAAAVVPLSLVSEKLAVLLIGLFKGHEAARALAAYEHLQDPLRPMLQSAAGLSLAPLILFLLAVVVPIGEEVFFRGLVYGGLRSRWGVAIGALSSAAFFAAVHTQVVHALPIFALGLLLALAYERTGSLVPAMVAHGINNIVAVLSIWRGWTF
jgi:membrane protease YdiL (CAAX protease family)